MEKNILKKLLIITLIIMLIATDFFMLGSSIISYAIGSDNSTNNENIEFSSYFKNEKGERVENLTESIKKENLKLYAEIKVKNEGYLNGSIEIENSNFKIKNNILSTSIVSIEENKVNFNQINAGDVVELELDIEPIISETLTADMLSKDTVVKLSGTYMETTYKGLNIEASKTVNLNLKPDESTQAELLTEIITNKVFSINGENKRIVQLLIKSKLTENQYPIKQTSIKVNVPQLGDKTPEEVKVLSLGTIATNGKEEAIIEDWKNENGIVEITMKNDPNENNEIKWVKNVNDEIVVTFIYSEDADSSKIEIESNSEIQVYNSENKYNATHIVEIENKELNNIISTETQALTTDLYKGQLYENAKNVEKKEIQFTTTTAVEVKSTGIVDKITVKEEKDTFKADTTILEANTKFISTEINKEKMLEILGEEGTIQINTGEIVNTITKDTEANESGNIVVNYENIVISELEIIISNPVKEGKLVIKHQKAIMGDNNTVEQLKTVRALNIKNTVISTLEEQKVVENSTEIAMELKETTTKAELILNKENLSTITQNTNFMIGIKLLTANKQYDLYKNPTIKIQLPSSIEDIQINSFDKLYGDEFEIERAVYNKAEKTIEIVLKGEQLKYDENDATQLYIQINFDVTLSKIEPSKQDKITMQYTNENAIQYDGNVAGVGYVERIINISSPSGVVAINSEEVSNAEGISGISDSEQIINISKKADGGKELTFKIAVVNNTNTVLNNVIVLGNFPTDGEFKKGEEKIANNLTTTLKGTINAQNCTIYYSNNTNATEDITDVNNGWKQNVNEVTNPKVYLMVINQMDIMTNFEATYMVKLPSTLDYDLKSYTGYQVLYSDGKARGIQTTESTLIGLTTGEGIKLSSAITARVGNNELNDGDTVKAGEVIKYKVTVKNNGTQTLENIEVKSLVPEGTIVVEPDPEYVYNGANYYIERTDITEMSETIESLAGGQEYTFEYEVRVKMDITNGAQISNKAIVTYGEYQIESTELKNILSESKIRVTIKRVVDSSVELLPGSGMTYKVFVENLSDEAVKNITTKIIVEGSTVESFYLESSSKMSQKDSESILINEIPAQDIAWFNVTVKIIDENPNQISATVEMTDSNGNMNRSNEDIQKVSSFGVNLTLTSTPDNGEYINIGDTIEYQISVENTGNTTENILVYDNISEYLELQELYIDGDIKMQSISPEDEDTYTTIMGNEFRYYITVEPGAKKVLTLVAEVKEINEAFETKTITNLAKASISEKEKATSSEITHIIQGKITQDTKNIISGIAWLDEDGNGQKDEGEQLLPNITVKLFDVTTNAIALDKEGQEVQTITNSKGEYILTKINEGEYIVMFEYDTTKYEPTAYMKEGVAESQNSNVVAKNVTIGDEEKTYAVTDRIAINGNISNINIGLKEIKIFDLQLNKYISKIVVQNSKGTKSYDYENSTFQKVEIHSKQIKGSIVILEYSIKVKNNGEVAGYVNNIVDYLPEGLTFSSELNSNWYLSDNNLYNKSLANEKINPGEEKEVKLILTKAMTESNLGLINNRAELYETYNEYGLKDINSTENNQAKDENDFGSADVVIAIATGGKTFTYTFLIVLNSGLIIVAIYLIMKNSRRTGKVERR